MGRIRVDRRARLRLMAAAALVGALLPFVAPPPPAAAADVVLPPILLVGADGEDNGTGAGNPAARVDTWSYQIRNPNPFDLVASIQVNSDNFVDGETGLPNGSWLQTQVTAVLVPANSATAVEKRLVSPPALGTVVDGDRYAFRAIWNDYPSVESNYGGIRWPELIVIGSSLGAAFTDPGPPFVGTGGVIEGFIDNRGPDFVSGLACEFDAAGVPTGDYTYEWWVQNSAFTGNPELLNVQLTQPNEALVPGVPGLPRQTVDWAIERVAVESVSGTVVTPQTWQHARAWFVQRITNQITGGTAADNTYPWTGANPPGSVWALSGSIYAKHTTTLVQADDCATKYADLPTHNPPGPPTVAISDPPNGATVSGTYTVAVDATDDDPAGTLVVEVSTDAGASWNPAEWNAANSTYDYYWDTTAVLDGPGTIDARATDGDANTTTGSQIVVTIDNSPTVAFVNPTPGATIGGVVMVEVAAADNDAPGTLTVESSTDGGVTWNLATWNGPASLYRYTWDTTLETDGPGTLDARATDSDGNTTNAIPIAVTIQNTPIPPAAAITSPAAGSTVAGPITVAVDATDDDPIGTLGVEVSTNGGTDWNPAPWNAGSSRYEYVWDSTATSDGAATLDARATDSDGNTTNAGQISVTVDNVPDPALLVAAGDIASCELTSDDAVGDLLDTIFPAESGSIATLGDTTYPNGTPEEFDCFDDAWGQHKALINPAVGNHEYLTPGATGYYGYFGAAAGDPAKGYYSYDIGDDWHAIVLNSNCAEVAGGCAAGGAQEQWLRAVLAANSDKNVVAYWHHPRWTKNQYNDDSAYQPFWQALYEYGAEIVMSGHEHHYERYVPLDASGSADSVYGVREFLVGTGGITPRVEVQTASPLSHERHFGDHGVLKLYLLPDSYSWEFVSVSGAYSDSGTSPVHDAPGISPTVAITSPGNGSVISGTTTISVNATDDDPLGTLNVEVSTDGGTIWSPAPWNGGASRYQFMWDTKSEPDGPVTIDARAIDSDTNTATAPQINVTVANIPTGSYSDAVIADGANVYWRLAEGAGTVAIDELGLNNASYIGNPAVGAPGLIVGGNPARAFDGIDDAVHLVNSVAINQGGPYLTKSIELWFSLTSNSPRQMLYEQGSITRGLSLYVLGGALHAGIFNTSDNGGDTPWGPVFLSTPVSAGAAHHAVIVFDQPNDTFSLYLDGILADSATGIGELHDHGLSAIGAQRDWARYHDGARFGNLYNMKGTIDEVALYPVALNASTVAAHHVLGTATGPVAPSAIITAPGAGAIVSGTTPIRINATDDDPSGTLSVEVSTDGGVLWHPTIWNAAVSRYEYPWDTTSQADGPASVSARATDSDANTSAAPPINVTINNAVAPPYRDTVLNDGASVYWRLGEAAGPVVLDELGGNNNVYLGAPTLGVAALITDTDTAVDFDGIDDTIRLINSVEINQENPALTKTIELWFNAANVSPRQVLLEQGSVARGLNIYLMSGRLYAGIYNTNNSGGDTPWGPVFISTSVNAATTYHVAVVFDQPTDSFRLYLNGVLADTGNGIGQLYPHGRSAIGSQWDWARYHDGAGMGNQYYFDGTLDEIAIYPNALTAATVAGHYASGSN